MSTPISRYKTIHNFDERKREAEAVMNIHPDRVPVICEDGEQFHENGRRDTKFLVPSSSTVGQFIAVVRKRLLLPPDAPLYLFVGKMVLEKKRAVVADVYARHKELDGFLYLWHAKKPPGDHPLYHWVALAVGAAFALWESLPSRAAIEQSWNDVWQRVPSLAITAPAAAPAAPLDAPRTPPAREDAKSNSEETFARLTEESQWVLDFEADCVPVMCEKADGSDLNDLERPKMTVPSDCTFGYFSSFLAVRVGLDGDDGRTIRLTIDCRSPVVPEEDALLSELYAKYKADDKFLHVKYSAAPADPHPA